MARQKRAIGPRKRKRDSTSSQETFLSDIFERDDADSEVLGSPLSDYPDNLSDCSEAKAEKEAPDATGCHDQELESEGPGTLQNHQHFPSSHSSSGNGNEGNGEQDSMKARRVFPRHQSSDQLTPPAQSSIRNIRSTRSQAHRSSVSSAPLQFGKRMQGRNSPSSINKRSTTKCLTTSTPRRSERTRRPPPKFTPTSPIKDRSLSRPPKSKSLIIRFVCKTRDSAGESAVQTMSPPSFPVPQTPSKPKRKAAKSASNPRKRQCLADITLNYTQPKITQFIDASQRPPSTPNQDKENATNSLASSERNVKTPLRRSARNVSSTDPMPLLSGDIDPRQPSENTSEPPDEEFTIETALPTIEHDDGLKTLASSLLASRNIGLSKPEPTARPEIWADTRMELCETLPYYRSYHGGSYHSGGFSRAFMFSKHGHHRDYMDASVIVSCAGGGRAKDKDSGKMTADKDQTENASVESLRNSMSQFNPVVIITSADNPFIPSKPPHEYCVLDHFKPVDIWSEKSKGKKIFRYRFEKLNTTKPSWWQPKGTTELAEPGSLDPPIVRTCSSCSKESEQVYLQGWMCLNSDCSGFWMLDLSGTLSEPKEDTLLYDPRFLKKKTVWPNDDHVYPLVPTEAPVSRYSVAGEDYSVSQWVGRVCTQCGRCNARLGWTGWECQTPGCTFTKKIPPTLIPAAAIRETYFPLHNSYTIARDTHEPFVSFSVYFAHNYRIHRYEIPGIEGFVTHMIANKRIVEEPAGPDDMFEELQRCDIGLRRRVLGGETRRDRHYTRHYTVNYGMPYKFVAATASLPFEGAAQPITATRSRLNWAAKLLLSQEEGKSMNEISAEWKDKEFNEVLALGYFESQKISYHDDGEHGLGPTIATVSLGATGSMRIRMKAKHHNGASKSDNYTDCLPLPGCSQYEARLKIHDELQALKEQDKKKYSRRIKELPKQLGLKSTANAKDAIVMTLGHGDIVVMHGAELQKYYEHSVDHSGKLRFALTCRYIDPESLEPGDQPTYDVAPDTGNYDGSTLLPAA